MIVSKLKRFVIHITYLIDQKKENEILLSLVLCAERVGCNLHEERWKAIAITGEDILKTSISVSDI